MGATGNGDDDLLVGKILVICSSSVGADCQSEALLCALLLWTRIQSEDAFDRVLTSKDAQRALAPFVLGLLENHLATEALQQKQVSQIFVRLVCLVLIRVSDGDTTTNFVTKNHAHCILKILQQRSVNPVVSMDVDMLHFLRNFYSSEPASDSDVLLLWKVHEKRTTMGVQEEASSAVDPVGGDESVMMIKTLEALLEQTDSENTATDLNELWHGLMWEILRRQHLTSGSTDGDKAALPGFWTPALHWCVGHLRKRSSSSVSKHAPSATMRARWAWLLLYIVGDSSPLGRLPKSDDLTFLLQLILAAVVAPNDELPTLRPMAWTVALRAFPALLSELGLERQVCSLLRLAIGEWRIQLEGILREDQEQNPPVEVNSNHDNERTLLNSCGKMVVATVEWITEIDQEQAGESGRTSKNTKKMTESSILHVHHSLEQALHLCVQCLESKAMVERPKAAMGTTVVLGVFGALLTEFDIFLNTKDDEKVEGLIRALGEAMTLASEDKQGCLLLVPAVATVVASAQGYDDRVALLDKHGAAMERLVDAFWKTQRHGPLEDDSNSGTLVWVCQLMELWNDTFAAKRGAPAVGTWKQFLIEFLRNGGGDAVGLNAAVTCYIALQGSEAPPDRDAEVLQRVLSELQAQS